MKIDKLYIVIAQDQFGTFRSYCGTHVGLDDAKKKAADLWKDMEVPGASQYMIDEIDTKRSDGGHGMQRVAMYVPLINGKKIMWDKYKPVKNLRPWEAFNV